MSHGRDPHCGVPRTKIDLRSVGGPHEKMVRPEIMGPPIAWLLSDAAAFTGQRATVAARWDPLAVSG